MPDLPIHPQKREAPGYALERRLSKLQESPRSAYADAWSALRRRSATESLRLTGAAGDTEGELLQAQLDALQAIERAASSSSEPSIELIQEVHAASNPPHDGSFREEELEPQFQNQRPSPPRFIAARLENLLHWLSADSGRDMFPTERMALWFARFVEISPFPKGNFRTAHLFLSFFAATAGYPPVTLELDDAPAVRAEIERAIRFDTAPLVERFAEALSKALHACEDAVQPGDMEDP